MTRGLLTISLSALLASATVAEDSMDTKDQPHPYVGLWVTADGHIRLELQSGGRYDEARGTRKSAYTGRYSVRGDVLHFAPKPYLALLFKRID